MSWGRDNIGILAYGSLLGDAGPHIKPHIIDRIEQCSPFPVEYARSSKSWGCAPTLVQHPRGGPVQGKILVLDVAKDRVDEVKEWLRIREGKTKPEYIKAEPIGDFKVIVYADLPANIHTAWLCGDHLARLAIDSVGPEGDKNGIRYLRENIEKEIFTPLTEEYKESILKMTETGSLEEAEEHVRQKLKNN